MNYVSPSSRVSDPMPRDESCPTVSGVVAVADTPRADVRYRDGGVVPASAHGIDVTTPVEGFYRFRLNRDAVRGGVRIWYGAPHDPVTGEELDRSWRWQATFDGEPIDLDRVWPACAGDPLTEQDYRYLIQRREWAEKHAPDSAYAKAGRKLDPLSASTPLPF